jgi:raffinose/stachyose/melibiose transport system substrate-binding protein
MTTTSPYSPRRALTSRALAAIAVCGALALGACGAPGSGSSTHPKAKSPSSISTNPAKAGKVTLSVWDQEVRGGQNAEITQLNKEFSAKYPNVTVKRTSKSFSDLKTTLKLALSGNNPPDVVEANQGYPDMVAFVKAGMLLPLDAYAQAYGWTKRYPASLLALNKVSSDASHFGEGKLYGLSQMGEYVGVYYNKTKLKQVGLTPPTTWSELVADLSKIKARGELPIQFGNLDKWPAIHTFGTIQAATAGKQDVRNLVFGTGHAAWTSAPSVQAAKTLQEWATKGYFPSGVNGIGYDDANKQFAHGKGVFEITGTWEAATLKGPMGSSLGLMPTPPGSKGLASTGGESLAFGVTSKSKTPDVAAAYINFITNAHAADVMLRTGNLPAVPGQAASSLSSASLEGQMVAGWQKINSADGLVPYLDYSTPTFYDTITAALQDLIGGKTTPRQFTETLQADYSKFHQG